MADLADCSKRGNYSDPDPAGPGVALLESGVIGEPKSCAGAWCQIRAGVKSGWLQRVDLFGIYPDESIR